MSQPKDEKLNGWDYTHMSTRQLAEHKDFSPHALRIINAVMNMTTEQLEKLNVIEGERNGL